MWIVFGALVFLATACSRADAPPPRVEAPAPVEDLVVLLPGPEGAVGTLTVQAGTQEWSITTPYEAVRIGPDQVKMEQLTEAQVNVLFGSILAALPPRPARFVLFFVFGTETLAPASLRLIDAILQDLAQRPAPEVRVTGHTDRTGSAEINDPLSLRRAEKVRTELMGLGIPADRIEAVGRGSREATGDDAKDRRVDIVVR